MDLHTEGNLGLTLFAEDVAHGAAGDGDAGGDLVTDWTMELSLNSNCHGGDILSIIHRRSRLRNTVHRCRDLIDWNLAFFLDIFHVCVCGNCESK